MKAISDAFWCGLGLCLLVASFQAYDELAQEAQPGYVQPDAGRPERANCNGVIRVDAPYDLGPELTEASALTGNAVRFKQVRSGADITIHDARLAIGIWGQASFRGREVWLDFERIPAQWLGRIALHEILHNAGFDNLNERTCDIMAVPPNWCDGRPIVRSEYVRGLQRLARCEQERPSSIQATSGTAGIVTDYAPTEVE